MLSDSFAQMGTATRPKGTVKAKSMSCATGNVKYWNVAVPGSFLSTVFTRGEECPSSETPQRSKQRADQLAARRVLTSDLMMKRPFVRPARCTPRGAQPSERMLTLTICSLSSSVGERWEPCVYEHRSLQRRPASSQQQRRGVRYQARVTRR